MCRNEKKNRILLLFLVMYFAFTILYWVVPQANAASLAELDTPEAPVSVSMAEEKSELKFADLSPALLNAEGHVEKVVPRTTQFNVFCVPVDTSGVTFDFSYTKNFFKRVCVSYHTIPAPMTNKEFADLDSFARKLIGVPYVSGGRTPSEGFDCSGFVLYVLSHCGGQMTAGACEGQLEFCYILDEKDLRPGDLVFFTGTQNRESVSHVGIYLGDRQMIHAGMQGICIVDLDGEYWPEHFYCYGRPIR